MTQPSVSAAPRATPTDLPWGATWPSPEDFRALAADRRVVPVVRRLLADDVTPVGLYRTLAAGRPGTFVLESAESDGTWGRWSFVGVSSRATLSVRDGRACWSGDVPVGVPTEGDVLDVLGRTLDVLHTPRVGGLPPLTGGLVGVLGWDVVHHWEPTLPRRAPEELDVPEVTLVLASDVAAVDHVDGSVWLVANAINFDATDERVDEAYADAVGRLDAMQAALGRPAPPAPAVLDPEAPVPVLEFRSTREEFEEQVRRGQEAIRDGDVFQVVLSQRLDLDCPAEPVDVYRVLRTVNPSPYMYLLALQDADGRDFAVVGSSPETLVKVSDGHVTTFPIAGSRPRGATPEEDRALADEVLADPKERAEHIMLVDLSRNDMVKVCEPTSVEVVEFMAVRRFSHIMHICSTVVGRLRAGATALQTLVATFPAGTLSGAPKPRAIELIDELEPARRGVYGGTVGYFDFAGDMDMAIAIRTALLRDGRASVQAGGGIVADSVPALEYEESRNKAAAAVRAIQLAARLRRATP
ncbi:anthranilate synthase component I [Cellulomonas sp. zg-ZUI222]|uniref:Anthranilate synthase component 1 n=1 Tax=Cellulomonas wangleii TaxID=2816956 RepID=A0ABX8D093_9CELL|nr:MULTISPECIES: anthranilate synthase component I [Cellulomonas]MBO0900208.1 anthranilate synthase component I [Cellulomonas sp. zg-ZUI22]MBO0920878.1 anthranilate synthase component I [Cellulomonas wangleii]MBO0926527.1 anthranilate synthase component I [Cellulomonas wangleii]QVI60905.1 anthranilate synthase component I [Cellulomonas wangleii]